MFDNNSIVAILIKKAALKFDRISNPIFGEYGLSASQYKVLMFLYAQNNHATRVVDLEQNFSMTHPTVLGLLKKLEEKGFTRRVSNPNDARGKLVALTEKAESMHQELEALGDAVENKLTEKLTEQEKAELLLLLRKLMDL